MYSIKDLANNLGYSEDQVRNRLDQLRITLDEHIQRGKRNKVLLTNTGYQILERAKQLEDQGVALKELPKVLDEELPDKTDSNPQQENNTNLVQGQDQSQLIREKERRIEDLQSRVRYLETKLDERDQQIQQLLTGKVQRKNPVSRFFDWLF
ncbi:hypothetical protein KGY71_00175 [Candidatus Bipolaricaulota bacterium]|nr:hypothetical protein [Candidatus Bipolaricaulota bacterium]MBS3792402.1 hypothetical protein [Candidatus Bipolaricaulota bacterium]